MIEEITLRLFASFFIGFILSSAGSFSQALSQNPLASPSTLGIQAIALLFQISSFFIFGEIRLNYILIIFHLLFAVGFFLRKKINLKILNGGESSFKKLIIIGLCINLCVGSIYSLLQFVMLNLGRQFPGELWFGHFKFMTYTQFGLSCFIFFVSFLFSFKYSKRLRFYVIGKDFAHGVNPKIKNDELMTYVFMVYCVCIATFLFGVFSFIGLVFPHILKRFPLFKRDLFKEVVTGGLCAGISFSLIDQLCFHFPINGAELPLGLIMAVLGPLFLVIFTLKRS